LKLPAIFIIVFFGFRATAQQVSQLPDELSEVSGIELFRDSIFFAINDGGNKSEVYVISKHMKLIKKVEVQEVKNHDWEALALDNEYLYIGDIGNNLNKRKNLQIHRIPVKGLLEKTKVRAETMEIEYSEQKDFPPITSQLYFDAEAMTSHNGKLWIFTKNRTKPFDGKSFVYEIKFIPGVKKTLSKSFELVAGKNDWLLDSFTGAESFKEYLYLLTYSQIIRYKWKGNTLQKIDANSLPGYAQTEAITVNTKGQIFIANEANKWLGKQKIRQYQWNK